MKTNKKNNFSRNINCTIISLFIFSIFITNCKPTAEEVKKINNPEILKRVWMLTDFSNFEKKYLLETKAELNLLNPKQVSAAMGCNSISFKYNLKPNSVIVFSHLIHTEMACTNRRLEDEFLKFIPTVKSYKIDGHTLVLFNTKNEKMIFVAQDWD